ncbi:MAG: VOC family protein [Candidatus Delongbacteria bacterium]
MSAALVIFYVPDQEAARRFYGALLEREPDLHVPGMSEFALPGGLTLGLMPEAGIRRLLPALAKLAPAPAGPARAELYLRVEDPAAWLERALGLGARLLDPLRPRDWGERAGYVLDPWGHVLAFAC